MRPALTKYWFPVPGFQFLGVWIFYIFLKKNRKNIKFTKFPGIFFLGKGSFGESLGYSKQKKLHMYLNVTSFKTTCTFYITHVFKCSFKDCLSALQFYNIQL
jgi:hypothetical protein